MTAAPGSDRVVAFAPGRVNLIGEHTDYNGGLALPFAIERGVTVTATALDGGDEIEAIAHNLGERDSFPATSPAPVAGWRAFVRGMAAELAAEGVAVRPARIEIAGDLDRGAGLASSAALGLALGLALLTLAGDASPASSSDRLRLARICSRVESEWVRARTGLLDQLASLHGRRGHVLRIDFRELAVEAIPLDLGDWRLVSVDSGERHSNATGGYNQRRAECVAACEQLDVDSLRAADPAAADRLPEPLNRRVRHVVEENARVDAAVAALQSQNLDRLARLLDASHASLRDLFDASTPAVERTVADLHSAGAAGARMVGGGFGGHVLALLPPGIAPPPGATLVAPYGGARLLAP